MMDPMADPMADPGMGMDTGTPPEMGVEELPPEPELPQEPVDPMFAMIDMLLDLPGQDAIRRVYQLATSAARAKSRLDAMSDRLDARGYHDELSRTPEVRYARELIATRRELDTLAQERRRLNLAAMQARDTQRPASIYEMQSGAATAAMESIALGTLLFLFLPTAVPTQSTKGNA